MVKQKKEDKIEYFVQLGMKKNGRIVKNEQFDLEALKRSSLFSINFNTKIKPTSLFKRIFLWNKIKNNILETIADANINGVLAVFELFKQSIDADNFGKKRNNSKRK